jgi:DNA-directed RNA polymerase subunit RPC12/RpoP
VESKALEVKTTTQVTHKPAIGGGGRPQLVRVTDTTYEDHYRCRRCGHRWLKTGQESNHEPVKQA